MLLTVTKFFTDVILQLTNKQGLGTRLRQIGANDTIYGSHGLYVLFTAVLLHSNTWQWAEIEYDSVVHFKCIYRAVLLSKGAGLVCGLF